MSVKKFNSISDLKQSTQSISKSPVDSKTSQGDKGSTPKYAIRESPVFGLSPNIASENQTPSITPVESIVNAPEISRGLFSLTPEESPIKSKTPLSKKQISAQKYEDYLNKFTQFMELKKKQEGKYIKSQKDLKNKIKKELDRKPSIIEKKENLEKFKKSLKCSNCNKLGGVIFKDNKVGTEHIFEATCGNIGEPCNLSFKLQKPTTQNMPDMLEKLRIQINQHKSIITEYKLDLLFGLDDEEVILQEFQTNKENLQIMLDAANELHEYFNTKNYSINISNDPEAPQYISKKKYFNDKQKELNELVSITKKDINLYKKSGEIQLLDDIMQRYKNVMIPLQNEIFNNKYQVIYMDAISNSSNGKINKKDMPIYHFIPTEIRPGNKIIQNNDFEIIEFKK